MLDVLARLLPPINKFLDQIWPSVVATLIAAGLISGYNHAFSGHLQQPRMAALKAATDAVTVSENEPQVSVATKPAAAVPANEYFARHERFAEPPRALEKEASAEAGKDQSTLKIAATAPAPAPQAAPRAATNVANPMPRTEPRVASVPYVVPPAAPAPVTVAPMAPPPVAAAPSQAPLPPVAALPPPVITAAPAQTPAAQPPYAAQQQPYVTVPDRAYQQRPPYDPNQRPHEAQADDVPPPPQRGPLGTIVNTLNPATWFARAREFGDRIEQAGNDILPSIRQ